MDEVEVEGWDEVEGWGCCCGVEVEDKEERRRVITGLPSLSDVLYKGKEIKLNMLG